LAGKWKMMAKVDSGFEQITLYCRPEIIWSGNILLPHISNPACLPSWQKQKKESRKSGMNGNWLAGFLISPPHVITAL
jgi:hypothetical protein